MKPFELKAKKEDVWFMPQGGVVYVPSAKTENEAEQFVRDVLNAHHDIYCDWLYLKEETEV
jgi:hypothetical protein